MGPSTVYIDNLFSQHSEAFHPFNKHGIARRPTPF